MPQALKLFGDLLRFLAQAVVQTVHASVHTPWKELYLEIRCSSDGKSRRTNLHVVPMSGPPISVPSSALMDDLIADVWTMRNSSFRPPWYGMKLTLTSEGSCRNEFDYEPDRHSDPAFTKN